MVAMVIMNDNKVVAYPVCAEKTGVIIGMRMADGVQRIDVPLTLFGLHDTEVPIEKFFKWVEKRCFTPERLDADKLLKSLGLKEYNALEIVKITGGRITSKDNFWVDWKRNK